LPCLFALAAAGISLMQSTTRQIPFILAATMSIAAYLCHGMQSIGCPFLVAALLAIAIGVGFGCAFDCSIMQPLGAGRQAAWMAIAVSLGAYLCVQAALAIFFGEAGRAFPVSHESHQIGSGRATTVQVVLAAISAIAIGGLLLFLGFTRFGRSIRGLASNADLCVLMGIRTSFVRSVAVGVGGALTGIAAILTAADSGLVPSTGFTLFLSGVTAAILGGVGNAWGVAAGALLLASARHVVAYYGDPKWMDVASFLILIGFLIWKPLGFSGRRLKKVEI
jgi:branched-chain amino acid transport system permease protein